MEWKGYGGLEGKESMAIFWVRDTTILGLESVYLVYPPSDNVKDKENGKTTVTPTQQLTFGHTISQRNRQSEPKQKEIHAQPSTSDYTVRHH